MSSQEYPRVQVEDHVEAVGWVDQAQVEVQDLDQVEDQGLDSENSIRKEIRWIKCTLRV